MGVLFIVSEVTVLFIIFLLLYWLVGKAIKQLKRFPALSLSPESVKSLRQSCNSFLVLAWGLLSVGIISVNSWWLYQGQNIQVQTQQLISRVPPEFWVSLTVSLAKSISILMLVAIVLRPIRKGLKQASQQAKQFEGLTANEESINQFFRFLEIHLSNSLWLFALLSCTYLLNLPTQICQYFLIGVKVYVIVVAGLLLSKGVTAIIDSLDAFSDKYSNSIIQFYKRLQELLPFIKRCVEYSIYVSTATVVLSQIDFIANLAIFGPKLIKIIGIIFLCRIAIAVIKILIEEIFMQSELSDIQRQTRQTIIPLLQSLLKYLIYFAGGMSVLQILSIDPTPIFAAAGLLGLAVSLGAKNLVNDIISGFFILFENHYLVGDFIETDDAKGIVEVIELRTTRIRNPSGQLHILRNGDIQQVINYSKGYIKAPVELRVAYDCDLNQVYRIIEEVGRQLYTQYPEILEPTEVDGVERFGESEVVIRTLTTVKPGNEPRGTHDDIQGIFRKAIKEAFEQHGIKVPFARRVLTWEKNGKNLNQTPPMIETSENP